MKLTKIALLCSLALAPLSSFAAVNKEGDWLFRAGYSAVTPDESSGNIFVGGSNLGSEITIDPGSALGINAVYFINENWAIELLAATPFSHDINMAPIFDPASPDRSNPDVLIEGGSLGEAKHLPPTLSLLYYWGDNDMFHPYLGLGLNYTVFFDEEFTASRTGQGFSNLEIDSTFGLSIQWGMDIDITDKWLVNTSLRWIDMPTDAEFNFGDANGAVQVDIDPYVFTLAVGYRF